MTEKLGFIVKTILNVVESPRILCPQNNPGGVAGSSPLEGVVDKPTKRRESSCLQEGFV